MEFQSPSLKDGDEVPSALANRIHSVPRKTKYKWSALKYSAPLASRKLEAFPNSTLTSLIICIVVVKTNTVSLFDRSVVTKTLEHKTVFSSQAME